LQLRCFSHVEKAVGNVDNYLHTNYIFKLCNSFFAFFALVVLGKSQLFDLKEAKNYTNFYVIFQQN